MADQVESDTAATGGALSFEQQLAADRAAFLSGDDEYAGDDGVEQPSDTKKPVEKKPAKTDDEDSDLDEDDVADPEADAEEDPADEPEAEAEADDSDLDEEEPATKAKVDPETAKRLAAVRRTEERAREQLARERATFERERETAQAQLKERFEKVERFEKLAARARYNPVEILTELGLTEDDFEDAARDIYAHSKKAASDPKLKEATARSRRERELADEVRALKAKVDEREKTETTEKQKAEARKGVEMYVAKVAKSVPETLPLAQSLIKSNPAKAHAKIEAIANRIAIDTGSVPDAMTVLKQLEKDRRQALRDVGIDPKSLQKTQTLKGDTKKAANGADKAKAAGAKPTGKPLSFEEQKKLDREAFVNADDDDDN